MEYVVVSRNGNNYYTDDKYDAMRVAMLKIADREIDPEVLCGTPGHYKTIFPVSKAIQKNAQAENE